MPGSITSARSDPSASAVSYPFVEDEGLRAIHEASSQHIRHFDVRREVVARGEVPATLKIVLEGWVARYKELSNGRRQMLAIFVPGDMCDTQALLSRPSDSSLITLTDARILEVPGEDLRRLVRASPGTTKALLRSELVAGSIQREWIVSLGQRQALERLAHLFCETFTRLTDARLALPDSCDFPLTQIDIAEATGLTPVHVNRTLQMLRKNEVVSLRRRRLEIHDWDELSRIAMFDPSYLKPR